MSSVSVIGGLRIPFGTCHEISAFRANWTRLPTRPCLRAFHKPPPKQSTGKQRTSALPHSPSDHPPRVVEEAAQLALVAAAAHQVVAGDAAVAQRGVDDPGAAGAHHHVGDAAGVLGEEAEVAGE